MDLLLRYISTHETLGSERRFRLPDDRFWCQRAHRRICAAPACCGACADERRTVPADGGEGETLSVGQAAANKQYPHATARPPTHVGWRSSTSVRVPDRAVRHGRSAVGCRRGQRARGEARTDYEPSHGVRISNCRCDAPARCGAFADERRNKVAGDRGGPTKADAKLPRARRHRRPPQRWILSGSGSPLTGALIAPFPCEAPARWGAFADGWRVVGGDAGGECGRETLIRSSWAARLLQSWISNG
jgi:hypothetical protein